jgi:excinuclease UvrABC nuclease subunit
MAQLLLIPDARPLEKRLGRKFFRKAPRRPGVYLMRDKADRVVYVGKAKDLRQRLSHYRIANPDRMPRRHLRLVREVQRIEFQFCANESSALAREAKLLRSLKPRFNRAGVWPGKTRFIAWRIRGEVLELVVVETPEPGWRRFGPMGSGALHLQRSLTRLMWLAVNPGRAITELPAGWTHGRFMEKALVQCGETIAEAATVLDAYFWGEPDQLLLWLGAKFADRTSQFERTLLRSELEVLEQFTSIRHLNGESRQQLALL